MSACLFLARSTVTFTMSSSTAEQRREVTLVLAPRAGELLISSSHGRRSEVSMKSAPYNSKQFFLAQQPSIISANRMKS